MSDRYELVRVGSLKEGDRVWMMGQTRTLAADPYRPPDLIKPYLRVPLGTMEPPLRQEDMIPKVTGRFGEDHAHGQPGEVMIDGTRYVPVSDAHIGARAIEDAVVSSFWGAGDWRTSMPGLRNNLRIIVTDDSEEQGMTVAEFTALILAAAGRGES